VACVDTSLLLLLLLPAPAPAAGSKAVPQHRVHRQPAAQGARRQGAARDKPAGPTAVGRVAESREVLTCCAHPHARACLPHNQTMPAHACTCLCRCPRATRCAQQSLRSRCGAHSQTGAFKPASTLRGQWSSARRPMRSAAAALLAAAWASLRCVRAAAVVGGCWVGTCVCLGGGEIMPCNSPLAAS
jgi:hypothetical protein